MGERNINLYIGKAGILSLSTVKELIDITRPSVWVNIYYVVGREAAKTCPVHWQTLTASHAGCLQPREL